MIRVGDSKERSPGVGKDINTKKLQQERKQSGYESRLCMRGRGTERNMEDIEIICVGERGKKGIQEQ